MAWIAIRDKLVTTVKTASGIGQVEGFRRQIRFWDDYIAKTVKDGRVNFWEIDRIGRVRTLDGVSGAPSVWRIAHRVTILGRMSMKDEDETSEIFMPLVDAVDDKLRADPLLNLGTPGNESLLLPFETAAPIIGHDKYGDVLCHLATFAFDVIERVGGP
ncbi:hypothetical protein LCGC14_2591780 [marine sediment metagenome]|uniref:Uncharacterized protein n=1 Tax=marine sediment metagenome TaxID=412755 RepID=A0A0F9ABE8_9ZZZZ